MIEKFHDWAENRHEYARDWKKRTGKHQAKKVEKQRTGSARAFALHLELSMHPGYRKYHRKIRQEAARSGHVSKIFENSL